MSQQSFNNRRDLFYDSMVVDSPVIRQKFSRFSKLADRSTLSFSVTNSSMNETLVNQSNQLSRLSESINIPTVDLQSTIQLSDDKQANLEDDLERFLIFESFYELNHLYKSTNQLSLFDLFDQFDQTCENNMLVSSKMLQTTVRPDYEVNYFKRFSSLIRLERNSWRLFKALLRDRFEVHEDDKSEMEIEEAIQLRLSDLDLVRRAIERNSMLREMQIVIDWLESICDDESLDKLSFYSDGPQYWENTLHSLKINSNQSKLPGTPSTRGRTFCTEMDPDASIRSGVPLHDLDKEDENRLFYYLFKMIRSGQLQEGKDVAERLGYHWLSAALEGWILYDDPNYSEPNPEDENTGLNGKNLKQITSITGNPYRDLWKYAAWKSSKMDGTNIYERAIFAIFSGNRSVLMPHCTKWNDKLWAYFKCSLDVHLENFLAESNVAKPDLQSRVNIELPDAYWDNKLSSEEIFNEMETQLGSMGNLFTTPIEEQYHQIISKCIVLSKIDELIDHLYEWSKTIQTNREQRSKMNADPKAIKIKYEFGEEETLSKTVEPNLLRFFAHLVIGLQHMDLVDDKHRELCVEILEIYVGFLIEFVLVELVAFYTAFLPERKQARAFATLLELVDDITDRQLCVSIAKNAKLNLPAITSLVVENIRSNKLSYQSFIPKVPQVGKFKSQHLELTAKGTDLDNRKIHALDWLLLDEDEPQYVELLWQANALIRSFLMEQKCEQAVETFQKLPSDIVECAFEQWNTEHEHNFDFENVIREYLCNKAYFEACHSFEKWQCFLYNTKPRQPTKPKALTRLADRVAFDEAVKLYEAEMSEWNVHIRKQATITSEKIIEFLCFPEGIWIDIENLDALEELRQSSSQMETDTDPGDEVIDITSCVSNDTEAHEHQLLIQEQQERKKQEWNQRMIQLDGMRRIYIPKFVMLLHSVYHDSGNLAECLRIADIVADEQRKLYLTFTRDQTVNLLAKLRESSIEILNHCSDPLGCETN